ncbi:hypothetical protein PU560_17170 [Georgenia sp. 10Sc9-8]|uniref:Transporter n=1 Tax=Georgenia halotolerans TaxID=3028317 RepID=A0ABT5U4Y7_9MICO|nr:hypothetical protein [Georgenia halotolerans]
MTALLVAAVVVLGLVLVATTVYVVRADHGVDRAIGNEFAFFVVMGLLVTVGLLMDAAVVLELALLAAVLGYLAAMSLGRLVTRGGR